MYNFEFIYLDVFNVKCIVWKKRDMHEFSRVGKMKREVMTYNTKRWWGVQVIRKNRASKRNIPLRVVTLVPNLVTQIALNPKSSCVCLPLVSTVSKRGKKEFL